PGSVPRERPETLLAVGFLEVATLAALLGFLPRGEDRALLVGVGVGALAELDPQRRALELEDLDEGVLEVALVLVLDGRDAGAVDHDHGRVGAPLVGVAQLRADLAGERRGLL